VKLGYQWKLGGNNDFRVTDGGTTIAPESLSSLRPGSGLLGGWVFGMSCGIAFL
jgi:hypothetical protein